MDLNAKIKNDLKNLFTKDGLSSYLKLFSISMTAGFMMVVLPALGLNKYIPNLQTTAAQMVNPSPSYVDPMDNILPKLEHVQNSYKLQNNNVTLTANAAQDYDKANAYAVIDYDSGKVIDSKDLNKQESIASLTKIMTAVVALDLASPSDLMTVSEKAEKMVPTKIGVVAGQKLSLEELLNAAILTSANDAVQVIKEGVDAQYNNEIFIKSMNAKAKFLNLSVTNFNNPQGFDSPDHHSSAADLAVLSHYALQNYPLIEKIAAKEYQFLPEDKNHKQFDLYNWNGLLGVYPGAKGIKIGSTEEAGKTTIVLSEREGRKVLVVLLGAPGILERDLWASELLDLGFQKEFGLKPVNVTEEQLRAKYGTWKYFGD